METEQLRYKIGKEYKSIKSAFRHWQKEHPNFMTPTIIRLEAVKDLFIIEMSEGTGINHKRLFGVTLAEYDITQERFVTSLKDNLGNEWFNKCFYDYKEALIHIDAIKEYLKDNKPFKEV